jgi:hypothetical protein
MEYFNNKHSFEKIDKFMGRLLAKRAENEIKLKKLAVIIALTFTWLYKREISLGMGT